MERKTVTNKLILNALISFILVIGCIVGVSYAWLTRNTSIQASNPRMQILAPDITVKDFNVYQYDSETNTVTEAALNAEGHYEMTQYDTIFTERNVYTPLLFVVTLEDVTPGALTVNVYCDSSHTNPADDYLSNIVCVKAASARDINNYAIASNGGIAVNNTPSTASETQHMFDSAAKFFKYGYKGSTGKFCSVNASGNYNSTKFTDIEFVINVTAADLTTEPDGSKSMVVYLIFDYSYDLVRAQGLTAINDLGSDTPVPFPSDLTTLFFANAKNN